MAHTMTIMTARSVYTLMDCELRSSLIEAEAVLRAATDETSGEPLADHFRAHAVRNFLDLHPVNTLVGDCWYVRENAPNGRA